MDVMVLRLPDPDGTLQEFQVDNASSALFTLKREMADIDPDLLASAEGIGLFQNDMRIATLTPNGDLHIDNTEHVYRQLNGGETENGIQQAALNVPNYGRIRIYGNAEVGISVTPDRGLFRIRGREARFYATCEQPLRHPPRLVFGAFSSPETFKDMAETSLTLNARAAVQAVVLPWIVSAEGQLMLVQSTEKAYRRRHILETKNKLAEVTLEAWRIHVYIGELERKTQEHADRTAAMMAQVDPAPDTQPAPLIAPRP